MTRARDNSNILGTSGTNGQVLTIDTNQNNGFAFENPAQYAAGKNKLINGDMNIWQRGTSFSGGNAYTADRWSSDGATTVSRDTGFGQFPYSLKIAATTGAGNPAIRQRIELPAQGNAGAFQVGTTWTLSFWAKANASGNFWVYIAFADAGGDANVVANSSSSIGAATTGWTKYTFTFTIAVSPVSTNAHLIIVPYLNVGATSQSTWFTGLQVEQGSVATPFTTASGTLQGELAACQRYYVRAVGISSGTSPLCVGISTQTTTALCTWQLPVPMRVAPSSTIDVASAALTNATTYTNGCTVTVDSSNPYSIRFIATVSGQTIQQPVNLLLQANGYIGVSAEL